MRWILVIFFLINSLNPLPLHSVQAAGSPQGDSVLVNASDASSLAWLTVNGAEKLVDYGAFSLWRLPALLPQAATSRPALPLASQGIYLRGYTLHTTQAQVEPSLPAELQAKPTSGNQFWLVQFIGPVLPAWLDGLQSAGLEVVAYLPENAYVIWGSQPADKLASAAAPGKFIQWQGAYQPAYRLQPGLLSKANATSQEWVDVTVQFYNTPGLNDSVSRLTALSERVLSGPETVLNLTNFRVRVNSSRLVALASWPDLFNIERYSQPRLLDEAQGQIVAGNLTTTQDITVPTGPGYLSWLDSKGFPTDPAQYPVVDVTDDGIGGPAQGSSTIHPDFYQFGSTANPLRVTYNANCTADSSAYGTNGHGNLNAGIISGYNNSSGALYQDSNGYHYGLGISPYGRVASSKAFGENGFDLSACGNSYDGLVQNAYQAGARIMSNSWGGNGAGYYDASSQAYDHLVRDADASVTGDQQMLQLFAAGNQGPGSSTLNSPATAKNVLAVGASENVRANGFTDGCGDSAAGNAENMAAYSSRGPTADLRAKPDLVAPGSHITGPAILDPAQYTGSSICNQYYPSSSRLYALSSGTSHSTPAAAGAAQLVYNYYQRTWSRGQAPSAAMLKALLLNSPRYLIGISANDTLPSPNQGWGQVDLGSLFDGSPRLLHDEDTLFTSSGQQVSYTGSIADLNKPFRVSLVWTDPPGTTSGNALVNDLDLEVITNGNTYLGNVFDGAFSSPGGSADRLNNVESVFIPAGSNSGFRVHVTAHNIAGDGVPGASGSLDQDFALVISNASSSPTANLQLAAFSPSEAPQLSNADGTFDPGERVNLQVKLKNDSSTPAQVISARLSVVSGHALLEQESSTYPDIAAGAEAANDILYQIWLMPYNECSEEIHLRLTVNFFEGRQAQIDLPSLPLGKKITQNYAAAGGSISIPDNSSAGINMPLQISSTQNFQYLQIGVDITHPWVSDLVLKLIAPNGNTIILSSRNGGSGDNYTQTLFDDRAATSILNGQPPFTGTFRPVNPLSSLNVTDLNGTWNLNVSDIYLNDTGMVNAFSLIAHLHTCTPTGTIYKQYIAQIYNQP